MNKNGIALMLAFALVGCGGPEIVRYTNVDHPNGTVKQLLHDRYVCIKQSAQPYIRNGSATVEPECGAFQACMQERGYRQYSDGKLQLPEGTVNVCGG